MSNAVVPAQMEDELQPPSSSAKKIFYMAAVPLAIDEQDNLTLPSLGLDRTATYRCPFCKEPVRVQQMRRRWKARGGSVRTGKTRPHWRHCGRTCAHRLEWLHAFRRARRRVARSQRKKQGLAVDVSQTDAIDVEATEHNDTQFLVAFELECHVRRGLPAPEIHLPCRDKRCDKIGRVTPTPIGGVRVDIERKLRNGRVADVVLLGPDDGVLLAIEIFWSHEVSAAKRAGMGVPWIEMDARDYQPRRWRARQGSFPLHLCHDCEPLVLQEATWWENMRRDPEIERFMATEMPKRLANVAANRALRSAAHAISAAQCLREFEAELPPAEQAKRVDDVKTSLGLEWDETVYEPHVWYCHSCTERMLVFKWKYRKYGAPPPSVPPAIVDFDEASGWCERCPSCRFPQRHLLWGPRRS